MIAAYFVYRLMQEADGVGEAKLRQQLRLLAILLAAIGGGSGLWHFWRTPVTLVLDVIPIFLFLGTFLWFLLDQQRLQFKTKIIVTAAFIVTAIGGPALVSLLAPLGSGGGYMFALLFAFGVNIYLFAKDSRQGWHFLITLVLFAFSLSFRQFDGAVCDLTGTIGFHYLWHTLNAIVLYRFASLLMLKSDYYIDNKEAEKAERI